jgi:asparagine synthase (glutamine-hydrolysing)
LDERPQSRTGPDSMCGIAGILLAPKSSGSRQLAAIRAMTTSLRHRGPDGDGAWFDRDAGIALGHRRLAIVDLSEAGHQPMMSHNERLVITYNGEIYNSAGLRPELDALGHRFRGHSDTEVMLAAFESFGIERALGRFAGMFSLGLWDRKDRALHLVRDRLGKKPLYVAPVEGALLFASELKAFRAFPGFQPTVDARALAMLLRQGWIPDHHCIWEGVFKLPPGSMLSVTADDLEGSADRLRESIHLWWSLAEVAEAGQRDLLDCGSSEAEDELDRLLRVAVGERMVADVPLGAFLSGGIDSSVVVALMQAQALRPVRTFTIGFEDSQYDEAHSASLISRHLGTQHTEFRVTASDAHEVIPRLPEIWDEPFADESQIPTYLVAQLARQHVTVALSGDGGDECFGGYARHFVSARIEPIFGLPLGLRRLAASALHVLNPNVLERLVTALPLPTSIRRTLNNGNLQKLGLVLDAASEGELYRRLTQVGELSGPLDPVSASSDVVPPLRDLVSRLIYRDMAGYLPGDILVKADRACMAVSIEARCPLLDHRVVEFAWRLPTALKVRGGKGKWLLRRVLSRYIPASLFERPKHGFNVPIGAWLRGPLREWAEELLTRPRIRSEGFLESEVVHAHWLEHVSGRRDRGCELWAILMFQAWLEATRRSDYPVAAPEAIQTEMVSPLAHVFGAGDWINHV